MPDFNLQNLLANDILIYDEINQAFINVPPATIKETSLKYANNQSDEGIGIFNRISSDDTLLFRTLKAGSQIKLTNLNTHIQVDFLGDASTLLGKNPDHFLLKANNLSDLPDITIVRNSLDIYSKSESHDRFMEIDASNVPDLDNKYDLGSNGRRYADIYATTFHGTATNALRAQTLASKNANDEEVLTWSSAVNDWVPKETKKLSITDLARVDDAQPKHNDILQFNNDQNRWVFVEYVPSDDEGEGNIIAINNAGTGVSVIRSRIGDIVEMRTLRSGSNISIVPVSLDNELIISADVPDTTDELPEGSDNLYFTDSRVLDFLRTTKLSEIGDVANTGLLENKGLIWSNDRWRYEDVAYNLYSTDDLAEGTNNLYYTDGRVVNVLQREIDAGIVSITDLNDVNSTLTPDRYLYFNGMNWVSKEVKTTDIPEGTNLYYTESRVDTRINFAIDNDWIGINDVAEINTTTPIIKDVLYFDGTNWVNQQLISDDVGEGTNLYYTDARVDTRINFAIDNDWIGINDIAEINTTTPITKDILYFDGATWINHQFSINDISEINTVTPIADDVLYFDGTTWVNQQLSINQMSEINTVAPNIKEVLYFDGTAWVNQQLDTADIAGFSTPSFESVYMDKYYTSSAVTTGTIDVTTTSVYRVDGTLNTTLVLSGTIASTRATTINVFIASSGGIFTWPVEVSWHGNVEPVLGTTWTNVELFWTGTMWIGRVVSKN